MALEGILETLLSNHVVASWKVTSEGHNYPTVVLRFKPVSENQDGVPTQLYRRKSQSQLLRDRQRLAVHKQRLELKNPSCFFELYSRAKES